MMPDRDAEISYDLVMGDDMDFAEGTFRLADEWQVFIVSRASVDAVEWKNATWDSGVTGIVIRVPYGMRLNMAVIEETLSQATRMECWKRVKGPDSMQLR